MRYADAPQTTASPGQMPSGAALCVLGGASASGTRELAAGCRAQFLHRENGPQESPLSETFHEMGLSSCKCIQKGPPPLPQTAWFCSPRTEAALGNETVTPVQDPRALSDTEASWGRMRQDAYMGTHRTDAVGPGWVGTLSNMNV